jgi:integrase
MICTRQDGTPWEDEKQMQTAVSHYLRDLEADGKIGAGTTLHGLRTSYAADLRRNGAETGDVAAALGDKSERMGAHYTRHVENEAKVIRAFEGKKRKAPEQR